MCTLMLLFWFTLCCLQREEVMGRLTAAGNSVSVILRAVNHCCFAHVQEVRLVKETQAQVKDVNFNPI